MGTRADRRKKLEEEQVDPVDQALGSIADAVVLLEWALRRAEDLEIGHRDRGELMRRTLLQLQPAHWSTLSAKVIDRRIPF